MIYLVSNRVVQTSNDLGFGNEANSKGVEELRIAKAEKLNGKWIVSIQEEKDGANIDTPIKDKPSFKLFKELQDSMRQSKRNCVFFVHGYNTNLLSAIENANKVKELYDTEVILFSWPSLGAGESERHLGKDLIGTLNYKRDKRVAKRSVDALDKTFATLSKYFDHTRKDGIDCGQNVNLLVHSMGNYILKHIYKSTIYSGQTLLFDNVFLVAADVNNADHEQFVDKIPHRRRVYIAINENDYALKWSRRKLGEEQQARLGHYTRNLSSKLATYFDFTESKHVDSSHSYFTDKSVENPVVFKLFNEILNGNRGERTLSGYDPEKRIYSVS